VLPETFVKNERTLTATADGGAEIDADEAFDQVVGAIDDVLKKSRKVKGEITHAAASSFWHSLVGIDKRGKPTTKVFGWAETRPAKYTPELRKKLNEAEAHNRTGARIHSSFWPAKLFWLKKDFPRIFAKTDAWLSLSDYAALRLSGKAVTSISMASGTGIFDIRKCAWDRPLIKLLGIKRLPEISTAPFTLNAEYAKRWPRLKNAGWFPAIGDGAANNIGAGCVRKSKAALMVGTSGALRVVRPNDGSPPRARISRSQIAASSRSVMPGRICATAACSAVSTIRTISRIAATAFERADAWAFTSSGSVGGTAMHLNAVNPSATACRARSANRLASSAAVS